MQMLEIDWGSGSEMPKICCPICGTLEDPENTDYCAHLNFIYLPGYDEFEYVGDSFATTVDALKSTRGSQGHDHDNIHRNLGFLTFKRHGAVAFDQGKRRG